MDKYIVDTMKKESKWFFFLMLFGYVILALILVGMKINNTGWGDNIVQIAIGFFAGSFGLYGWLYGITYKVEISQEKVLIKTLFRRFDINIGDIETYTCERYQKSVFYQFNLFTKDKRFLLNTRYKQEFIDFLQNAGVKQVTK